MRNLPTGLVWFGEPVGGDAALDVECPVWGDGDVELEEFIDSALVLRCRVGEVPFGILGDLLEGFELYPVGRAALFPQVGMGEVVAECLAFVGDQAERVGELGVVDLFPGVGADHPGFVDVAFVEASSE